MDRSVSRQARIKPRPAGHGGDLVWSDDRALPALPVACPFGEESPPQDRQRRDPIALRPTKSCILAGWLADYWYLNATEGSMPVAGFKWK
jgi:hypothetical protein